MAKNGMRKLTPDELALVCGGSSMSTVDLPSVPVHPDPEPSYEYPDWPDNYGPNFYDDPYDNYGDNDGGGGGGDDTSYLDEFRPTGLGPQVDIIVNKSPTLENMLILATSLGIQIVQTTGASEMIGNKLHINTSSSPEKTASILTHELGHALSSYYEDIALATTKNSYVQAGLDSEAEATLWNIQVQRELATQGVAIPIEGSSINRDAYNAAYDRYIAGGSWSEAVNTIASVYGTREFVDVNGTPTNLADDLTYADYYGRGWDAQHPATTPPAGGGSSTGGGPGGGGPGGGGPGGSGPGGSGSQAQQ